MRRPSRRSRRAGVEAFLAQLQEELRTGPTTRKPCAESGPQTPRGPASAGHPGRAGSSRASGGQDRHRAAVRGGLSGLFVWISAEAVGAPGAGPGFGRDPQSEQCRWVVDADIVGFFDHVDHRGCCCGSLQQQISDRRVLRRLIGMADEQGSWTRDAAGATRRRVRPRGRAVTPLLANVYLHVLDEVWEESV